MDSCPYILWREVSAVEACHYASSFVSPSLHSTSSNTPPPTPSPPTSPPRHNQRLLDKGRNSYSPSIMNSSNKAYLPSQRMLPGFVAGLPSPSLPPSSVASHSPLSRTMPPVSDHSPTSPTTMYESYRDSAAGGNVAAALAGVYGRGSPAETSAKAAAVASLAYARMHQDTGFPYGISGVAMPSYNYGSELYNYVSNGFPRKSRICSYCAKVFTRSTTRRYHEKRCPLLRAAGSLMKGNADSNNVAAPTAATSGASENTELSGGVQPAHPPPLLAMTGESPPPLLTAATTSLTATTSLGQASGARPAPLNTSSFYTSYGSHSQSLLSTSDGTTPSSTSAAALMASPHAAAASSSGVDQNRNSVLTSAKQEADQGSDARSDVARDAGTHSPGSRESDLLRNKLRSRGGGDHQQMFSPLSVTSPSPSPGSGSVDDDADYDGAEDLTLRAAGSVVKPGLLAGGDLYTTGNAPPHKPHYLTDRHHPQALSQEGGTRYMMGTASGTDLTPTPVKVKLESGQEMLDASSDKDDSSYRDEDASISFRDDDDVDRFDYRHAGLDDMDDPMKPVDKTCGVCNQHFEAVEELRTHKLSHQKYKASACKFCGQRFLRTSMRMAHERLHSSEFPYGCVVCGKQFTRLFSLRQHVRRRHFKTKSKPQPCRHCGKQIASVFHLRNHVLTHRVLKSELMSLQFLHARPPTALSPIDDEASPELPPPPSIDSKASQDSPVEIRSEPPPLIEARALLGMTTPTASDDSAVVNGVSAASGSRDMEWCRLCEKEYPKSFMRYHERAHADQKPYECPTCKKRFGYKNNMKSHMKLHAGIKPYQCQICGAKFTRGSTLRRHARRHGITTDTIWDLFVPKQGKQAGMADRAALINQTAVRDASLAALQKGQGQRQRSPPEVAGGSRAMKADPSLVASMAAAAADVSPAGKTFDMRGYSPSPSLAQNLFASYSALPAVTQAMYQPYMATSQFLPYPGAAGFSPNPVSAVQSDALNLSMPDRQRRNSSSSTAGGQSQPRPPSSAASSQGPTQHAGLAMDVRSSVGQQHLVIRDDDDDKMEDDRSDYHTVERSNTTNAGSNTMPVVKVEPVVEGSVSDTKPLHPANAREIGVQVTLCCARLPPHGNTTNASTNDQTNSGGGGDTPEGSPTPRGSKLESIQHETLATLMASGQLFRCPYCDCYFTDYAVFRIHQKYHEPDHPFTCTACKEDCRDKVYFAVHMYEHHRR